MNWTVVVSGLFSLLLLGMGLHSSNLANAETVDFNFVSSTSLTVHYSVMKSNIQDQQDHYNYERSKYSDSSGYQHHRCTEPYIPYHWLSDNRCHPVPERGTWDSRCTSEYPYYWSSDNRCHTVPKCENPSYPYYWASQHGCYNQPEYKPKPTTTTPAPRSAPEPETIIVDDDDDGGGGGGCLIATAAYGTELAPQVQFLREVRDNTVMSTTSGAAFMTGFNQLYYSFSPTIADMQRENPMFQEAVRAFITPMVSTLSIMTLAEDGSEVEVLALGLSVIALNIGMYVASPTVAIFKIKNHLREQS